MSTPARPRNAIAGRRFWTGFILAILGAALFSSKAVVTKLTFAYGVDALTVMALRMMLALPFFAAVAAHQAWQTRRGRLKRLAIRDSIYVALLGVVGYYLSSYLNFIGLEYISAALERLILFLSPTFVLLISAVCLKHQITAQQWMALVLSYIGIVLAFYNEVTFLGVHVLAGAGVVLLSAFTYALYLVGADRILHRVGAMRLVSYATTTSAFCAIVHFLVLYGWNGIMQPAPVYNLSLIHATLHTVAPIFMIIWAVGLIGAGLTAQLGLTGFVSVVFLSWWLLGEPITWMQVAGTIFVLAGAVAVKQCSSTGCRRCRGRLASYMEARAFDMTHGRAAVRRAASRPNAATISRDSPIARQKKNTVSKRARGVYLNACAASRRDHDRASRNEADTLLGPDKAPPRRK